MALLVLHVTIVLLFFIHSRRIQRLLSSLQPGVVAMGTWHGYTAVVLFVLQSICDVVATLYQRNTAIAAFASAEYDLARNTLTSCFLFFNFAALVAILAALSAGAQSSDSVLLSKQQPRSSFRNQHRTTSSRTGPPGHGKRNSNWSDPMGAMPPLEITPQDIEMTECEIDISSFPGGTKPSFQGGSSSKLKLGNKGNKRHSRKPSGNFRMSDFYK